MRLVPGQRPSVCYMQTRVCCDWEVRGLRRSLRVRSIGNAEQYNFHGSRKKTCLRLNPRATEGAASEPDAADCPVLQAPLGIDFGKARIGLATCPGGFISAPLKILDTKRRLWLELAEEIIGIAQQQGVDGFVVGLPVTSRGNIHQHWTDSAQGRLCRNFAQTLHARARSHALPVLLFDETMTSVDAAAALGLQGRSRLKQQGKLDAVAAALLLTAYFERPEAAIKVTSIKRS
ncbi:hypothetical protein ABBQ32_001453 [Trebouxia sp. C0010 RCD-2024]